MRLTSTGAATSLSGFQIQRSLHKLGFKLTGAKTGGALATTKLLADLAAVFISLKRVGSGGEKLVWSRMSLLELVNCATVLEGFCKVTGSDAGTSYTAQFNMEIADNAALQLVNNDYLELNIENAVTGLDIEVRTVGHRRKSFSHLRIERTQFAAGDFKTIDLITQEGVPAMKVLIPTIIADIRINGREHQFTGDSTDCEIQAQEKIHQLVNVDTGVAVQLSYGPFTGDSPALQGDELKSVDVTNGNTATSVLVIRQDV